MPRSRSVAVPALAAACAWIAATPPVFAQATVADKAAAESLFDEGRKLMAAGNYAAACPKLAASQRLDAGVGTLLYLADCYEKNGQTASAWATFREATAAARAAGQAEREKIARERAAALDPKLSKLTIVVPAGVDTAGLEVRRDGQVVARDLWGSSIAVDPGAHVVEATAPGRTSWKTTVQVAATAGTASVTLPALLATASASPTATASASPTATPTGPGEARDRGGDSPGPGATSPLRTIGLVTAAAGVVAIGVGGYMGLRAKSKRDEANCPSNVCTNEDDAGTLRDAKSAGNLSTVFVVAGGVLAGAGATLWLVAPSKSAAGPARATRESDIRVGVQGAGVLVRGSW